MKTNKDIYITFTHLVALEIKILSFSYLLNIIAYSSPHPSSLLLLLLITLFLLVYLPTFLAVACIASHCLIFWRGLSLHEGGTLS